MIRLIINKSNEYITWDAELLIEGKACGGMNSYVWVSCYSEGDRFDRCLFNVVT